MYKLNINIYLRVCLRIVLSVMLSGVKRSRNISFLRCQTGRALREILHYASTPSLLPRLSGENNARGWQGK